MSSFITIFLLTDFFSLLINGEEDMNPRGALSDGDLSHCRVVFNSENSDGAITGKGSVTYDLKGLQLQARAAGASYYMVNDKNSYRNHQYSYVFNLCANLIEWDDLRCRGNLTKYDPHGYEKCRDTEQLPVKGSIAYECLNQVTDRPRKWPYEESDTVVGLGIGPAFQVQEPTDNQDLKCYRLGNLGKQKTGEHDWREGVDWFLADQDDPTAGVVLEYSGGDWCQPHASAPYCKNGCNRKLRLKFTCSIHDEDLNIPDEELAYEPEYCVYELVLPSRFGCPVGCPSNNGVLCSDQGYCIWDRSLHKPRCYCDESWEGDDCGRKVSSSGGGISASAVTTVIVILFALVVVVGLFYIMRKVGGLKMGGNSSFDAMPLNSIDDP